MIKIFCPHCDEDITNNIILKRQEYKKLQLTDLKQLDKC